MSVSVSCAPCGFAVADDSGLEAWVMFEAHCATDDHREFLAHTMRSAVEEVGPMRRVSREEQEAKRTQKGGWTRAQLAEWGVPWPPPQGWRDRLAGR